MWVSRSSVLDTLYPWCGLCFTCRKLFLTVPRSCCQRARSTLRNLLKESVAASWVHQMDTALGPVAPAGMTGIAPGLGGGTTRVAYRVA